MISARIDLPLDRDPATRFLPVLVAVMVLLAALAVAGAFLLHGLSATWRHQAAGTLTVQIEPPSSDAADGEKEMAARVEAALALLRSTPGVESAEALSRSEIAALLSPWLGEGQLVRELPLPAMIDVRLSGRLHVDTSALAARLKQDVPSASLDDHRVWLEGLVALGDLLAAVALGVLALIAGVLAVTVIYATRTGLAVHRDIIDVLHLVGARDDYIARQFGRHALGLGLRGGLIGMLVALPVLGLLLALVGNLEGALLPPLSLPIGAWVAILALPAVSGGIGWLTARLTVTRVLARMV